MRYVLLLLLVIVAALYFTVGIRIGMLNLTDTYLFNVTGRATYSYRTTADDQNIALTGICDVKKGTAIVRFVDPQGREVSQQCSTPGQFSLNLTAGGSTGFYLLKAEYKHFTGHLKLNENRFGAH